MAKDFQNIAPKNPQTKEQAIVFVLRTLKSPMAMISPDKNKALTLCVEYGITIQDLFNTMENILRNI